MLTSEAGLDVCLDILEQCGPVVGQRDFHVGFEVSVMTSEDAVVGLAQGLLLVFLGQEQFCPGVNRIQRMLSLSWKVRFTRSSNELASASETPVGHR